MISVSILLTTLIVKIYTTITKKNRAKKFIENGIKLIEGLSHREKYLIKKIMSTPDNSVKLNYGSGVTRKLEEFKIISRLTQYTSNMDDDGNPYFPYGVNPWVVDLYKDGKIDLKQSTP